MNVKVNGYFKLDTNKSYVILNEKLMEIGTLDVLSDPITAILDSGKEIEFSDNNDIETWFSEHNYSLTSDSIRWHEYNPNPAKKKVSDCSIRAYCAAENIEWGDAYDIACEYGKENNTMPNDNKNCDAVLKEHFGYTYHKLSKKDNEKNITVKEFAINHPEGTYVLSVASHLVTVINGEYYDSWDSGDKKVKGYYYK